MRCCALCVRTDAGEVHIAAHLHPLSTANAFSDGTAVIALFNDGKEYEVNSAGACQSYCPIQGEMFRE